MMIGVAVNRPSCASLMGSFLTGSRLAPYSIRIGSLMLRFIKERPDERDYRRVCSATKISFRQRRKRQSGDRMSVADCEREETGWGVLEGLPGDPMMWVLVFSELAAFGLFLGAFIVAHAVRPAVFASGQAALD